MSKVIWITGLSGSGKTTIATLVTDSIKQSGSPVIMLDGDILRECFGIKSKNNREERLEIAFTYSRLCRMISSQGVTVVIATIALFKEVHCWNRANLKNYYEIFIDTPIEELIKRDPKNIYKRALSGKIKNVAGLDLEVDLPKNPDIHFKFDKKISPQNMKDQILKLYNEGINEKK